MSTAMVVRTPWQFGERSKEENKNGVVLPKVAVVHPMSRLGDVNEINLRGSCVSGNGGSLKNSNKEVSSPHVSASPRPASFLPNIPNGVEVKVAEDRSKVHIPVFGNSNGLTSRIENRIAVIPSRSGGSKTKCREKLSVSQLERTIRDKMKTGYFSVKSLFQSYDPENRGKVTREQLLRILSTFLATNISLSQFNRVMKCLGLEKSSVITFDEFYQVFKAKKESGNEYPSWFFQDDADENCTASKVHMYLKHEASKNINDLLISLNIMAEENIIKPEFHKALKRIGYEVAPTEYEKLWKKYDDSGMGIVEVKKFVEKLTKKQKPGDAGVSKKRSKEYLREQSINIEKWLMKKFREGFHEMQHAFKEVEVDGLVSRDQFLRVLKEYGLFLKDHQLDIFLERCSVPSGPKIDYKLFLTMFQNRGANGLPSKILHNQNHNYHRASSVDNKSCVTGVSDIEGILMDMFHADFLKLLNKFQKIDQSGKGTISAIEFRACLESYFGIELLDVHFTELMRSVPTDNVGNINYQEFLARFDSNSSKTIFDSVSSLGDADDRGYFGRALSTCSSVSRQSGFSSVSLSGERDVAQLSSIIKGKLNDDFQAVENAFHELDEKNTKRMGKDVFRKVLTIAVPDITSKETDTLWEHIITNQAGSLEFTQFVRHFGFSMKSAVYPNSKRNPPIRGDQDFRILSHRFNSSKELIEDFVKNAVEQRYDEIGKIFEDIDKSGSGYVDEEQFKNVLNILCPDLTADEQVTLTDKYSTGKRIPWKKFMLKVCPRTIARTSTDVIMHGESID